MRVRGRALAPTALFLLTARSGCLGGSEPQETGGSGTDEGDRRMGDFFETTVDLDGNPLLAFATTQAKPDDVVSHPTFVKQVGGENPLGEAEWVEGWPRQG